MQYFLDQSFFPLSYVGKGNLGITHKMVTIGRIEHWHLQGKSH